VGRGNAFPGQMAENLFEQKKAQFLLDEKEMLFE